MDAQSQGMPEGMKFFAAIAAAALCVFAADSSAAHAQSEHERELAHREARFAFAEYVVEQAQRAKSMPSEELDGMVKLCATTIYESPQRTLIERGMVLNPLDGMTHRSFFFAQMTEELIDNGCYLFDAEKKIRTLQRQLQEYKRLTEL